MDRFRYHQLQENLRRQEEAKLQFAADVSALFHKMLMCYYDNMKNGASYEDEVEFYIARQRHFERKVQRSSHTRYKVSLQAYEDMVHVLQAWELEYILQQKSAMSNFQSDSEFIAKSVTSYTD